MARKNLDLEMLQLSGVCDNSISEPVSCKCRSTCQRRRTAGGCPCKGLGAFCNNQCTCGSKKKPCKNQPPKESSESSEGTSSDDENDPVLSQQLSEPMGGQEEPTDHEAQIQNFIKSLSRERLEEVAAELLRRQPEAYNDLTLPEEMEEHMQEDPDNPASAALSWCKCGLCTDMPTEVENKCCTRREGECVTLSQAFQDICLSGHILGINMRIREDEYAMEENRTNKNYRHYAYRNYIYWKYGRLGKGTRIVIPSCCVNRIRRRFPSPDGHYTGFVPGENLQD